MAFEPSCGPSRRELLAGTALAGVGLTSVILPVAAVASSRAGDGTLAGWEAIRAGGGSDVTSLSSALRSDGATFVVGSFQNAATFGSTVLTGSATVYSGFVALLAADGTWSWATALSGPGRSFVIDVAVLADGSAAITGSFDATISLGAFELAAEGEFAAFVARISGTGSWLSAAASAGTGTAFGNSVAVLQDGSAIVAGSGSDALTFGTTTFDLPPAGNSSSAFVAKLDASGEWVWATAAVAGEAVGFAGVYARGLVVLPDGVAVTGAVQGAATFAGTEVVTDGESVPYVAGLSSTGAWQWVVAGSATPGTYAGGNELARLADGTIAAVGYFQGTISLGGAALVSGGEGTKESMFVARVAPSGEPGAWDWGSVVAAGGTDVVFPRSIAALSGASAGSVVVCGGFRGTLDLGSGGSLTAVGGEPSEDLFPLDLFVARLDPAGTWGWKAQAGGPGASVFASIVSTRSDDLAVVAGGFRGTVTFGSTVLSSAGQSDVFVARFDPSDG
jgi:hypothetical protein